jgi:hypothetical protein
MSITFIELLCCLEVASLVAPRLPGGCTNFGARVVWQTCETL